MDRIIGIDYGRKRVGVAVSDPLGIFASALDTVPAAKIIEYIKNYAQKETITRFVVGYPMNMNNKPVRGRRRCGDIPEESRQGFSRHSGDP